MTAPIQAIRPKQTIDDLAIFGGPKLFDRPRPIGQLDLPDEEKFFAYARKIYESGCITNNGPLVQTLERQLCELHQVDHCVALANASLGLILLMEALADGRRGEVIMPAFTYPGLPHLAQWAGQYPRFCDVDPETHTLAPDAVEAAIGVETTAILAVHQVNSPCLIDELQAIGDAHGVPLFFDSVHGIHCTYNGRPLGSFGRAEIFSLHATKLLNGFEGGYATTNDGALADTLRMKRNFGIDRSGSVATLGLNAKLNEAHAALALSALDDQEQIIRRNRERVEAYHRHFAQIPSLVWIPYRGTRMNYEFALLCVDPQWPLGRDVIVSVMREENALARPYYSPPLHLSSHCPPGMVPPHLPVTERLARGIIQMPVGELVNEADIMALAELMAFLFSHAPEVTSRLSRQ